MFTLESTIPLMRAAKNEAGQIGIVVTDMERALRTWGASSPARGTWKIWTYGPEMIAEMTYLGEPAAHSMTLAMNGANPQLELIKPLTGPSIYHTWLDQHGPGMHHLGYYVDDLDTIAAEMQDAGFPIVQSGRGFGADGSGYYAYFDTRAVLGFYLEGIQVPKLRREPEQIWPRSED